MQQVYLGNWSNQEDMLRDFQIDKSELKGCTILYADYEYEYYEGWCIVIFRKNRKLYEVIGSHCSCYGMENQWEPQETSKVALYKSNPDIAKKLFGDKK